MIIHVIEQGDTIFSIANYYGVDQNWIIRENGIENPFNLVIGSSIVILFPKTTHQVEEGETLGSIANIYNVTVFDLLRNNSFLSDQEFLRIGDVLVIEYAGEKTSEISVTGYCFPFIEESILKKTLPYLSYLIIYSYIIRSNEFNVSTEDTLIIENAKAYGVAPIMQISLVAEEGVSESDVVNIMLNDESLSSDIMDSIVANVLEKGYAGISINTIYVYPSDEQLYIEFLAELIGRIKALGLIVFNSLIPNTFELISDLFVTQEYVGIIDRLTDISVFFPTSVGMVIGAPSGTSNFLFMQELIYNVLRYIPKEELCFGINTIGYIWELPYIPGVSEGNAISAETAYNLARDYGINIQFDEGTQAAYFIFQNNNRESLVRFRDARTVASYMKIVNAFSLLGVGVWNIMDYFNELWLIINSQYNIYKVDENLLN